ncbi:MAG TPA: hypothetical protein VHD14_03640 [Pseudolabrys sp.]|jgi:hypothetical protein|nr:hypothetical protein [Pseudolabrys sp.]
MGTGISIGGRLAWLFLLPGDMACSAFGFDPSDKRDLVRMLVNSLVWTILGVIVVALVT